MTQEEKTFAELFPELWNMSFEMNKSGRVYDDFDHDSSNTCGFTQEAIKEHCLSKQRLNTVCAELYNLDISGSDEARAAWRGAIANITMRLGLDLFAQKQPQITLIEKQRVKDAINNLYAESVAEFASDLLSELGLD